MNGHTSEPLMLDWTGERFVPWADAPAVAYEHLHRYLWLSQFVADRRVLDIASGEGYGTRILGRTAALAVGIDTDHIAVVHAHNRYGSSGLAFARASMTQLPFASDPGFDVIACFEAIEHIDQHEELITEAARVLRTGGWLALSTPNKEVYSRPNEKNPYHIRELSFPEINALLARHFRHVQYFGQRVLPASSMWPLNDSEAPVLQETIRKGEAEFERATAAQREPEYFVAVASQQPLPEFAGAVLLDASNELGRLWAEAIAWKNEKIQESADQVAALRKDLGAIQHERDELRERLEQTARELAIAAGELESIHRSRGWKFVLQVRRLLGNFR